MRRLVVLALGAVVLGCGSSRDLFTAHPEVAAEAGGQELRVERLADWLTRIKGVPLTNEAAGFVAGLWVDYTLFAQTAVNSDALQDSAVVAEVLWPEVAELVGTRWHDTLMARSSRTAAAAPESLYAGNDVRLLQHILFRVDRSADPPTKAGVRKKAENALTRAKGGANFGALATQLSEDPGSRGNQGYYPPAPRGKFVPAFDSAGWSLAPGAISGIVETPYGFHIIRRPPLAEVRGQFTAYAEQQAGVRLDSLYLDSLATSRELEVRSEAPKLMRAALEDREAARTSDEKLATYKGGGFTVAQFVRWVNALGPQYALQLSESPDSSLTEFARIIAQNTLLLREAEAAGIRLSAEEWKQLADRHRAAVDTMRSTLGLYGAEVTDSAATAADRNRVVALKLDEYFDRIARGEARPRPLPPPLSGLLRDRGEFRLHPAALSRAVEIAKETRQAIADSAAADSAAGRGPGAGAGGR